MPQFTRAKVHGILKNMDLLLDVTEIHAILGMVFSEHRVLGVSVGRDKTVHTSRLLDVRHDEWLLLNSLQPGVGNGSLRPGVKVTLYLPMEGYTLATHLACLSSTGPNSMLVTYPNLLRVHSNRQASRFSTSKDKTAHVEMIGRHGHVLGELQDINLEGLSFLGTDLSGEIHINEEVRLRLIPLHTEYSAMNLTGLVRFFGPDLPTGTASAKNRYSVQITDVENRELFNIFFDDLQKDSREMFRSAVMSEESYRMIAAI
ncbi:MAG: hypothetical protein H7839_01410 [Magnetococcus sp. YQC-5]